MTRPKASPTARTSRPFDFGDGYTIAPTDAQEVFTGVNGLPPGNASIQGTQVFDVTHGSDSAGTFTAYVTTIPTMVLSNDAQVLLVTDSSSSAVPVGSVFDVQTYPFGFVNDLLQPRRGRGQRPELDHGYPHDPLGD